MAVLVETIGILVPSEWPVQLHLIVQVLCGVPCYLLLVYVFKVKAYLELKAVVVELMGPIFCRSRA